MTSPLLWRHTELRLQQRHWHSVRYFIEIALHQDITLKNTVWGYTKRVSSTQSTKYYRFGLFSVCVKSHGELIVFFCVAPSPDAEAVVKWYIFCVPCKVIFSRGISVSGGTYIFFIWSQYSLSPVPSRRPAIFSKNECLQLLTDICLKRCVSRQTEIHHITGWNATKRIAPHSMSHNTLQRFGISLSTMGVDLSLNPLGIWERWISKWLSWGHPIRILRAYSVPSIF